MNCIRQRLSAPERCAKLESRLRVIAERESNQPDPMLDVTSKRAALERVRLNIEKAGQNMALADTPKQLAAMKSAFDALCREEKELAMIVSKANRVESAVVEINSEVAAAMAGLDGVDELVTQGVGDLTAARRLFDQVNVRLFLR